MTGLSALLSVVENHLTRIDSFQKFKSISFVLIYIFLFTAVVASILISFPKTKVTMRHKIRRQDDHEVKVLVPAR